MSRRFYLTVAALVLFSLIAWIALFQNLIYQNASIPVPSLVKHHSEFVSGAQAAASPPASSPAASANAQFVTVTYTDSGFVPDIVTINSGDTVIFKNKSSEPFWPASNPHPVHTDYPTTGGCTGSTFDACGAISPGGSWSFQFNEVGSWGYHNHLNPGDEGTVMVQ